MNEQLLQKIQAALYKSWSNDTCSIFEKDYPYYGQCAQTSIVIHENFGGDILKTKGWPIGSENGRHFYNRIKGVRYDFTINQFTEIPNYTYNIKYQDIISSIDEAETETNKKQIVALMSAFNETFNEK